MKKERLFYLDFVRAVAAVSIVITHFNARYLYLNPPMPEKAVLTTTVSNIYIGDWGVSLFFIISGAALMYVYEKKCELKTFYKKRFFSIYPMFWMAYIAAFIYSFYADKMMPHFQRKFYPQALPADYDAGKRLQCPLRIRDL